VVVNINQPWPYLAVAAFAALIGWYVWTQPHRPGTRYFGWLVGLWLVWALAAALQTVSKSPELDYASWVLQTLCALTAAPLQLMVALEYTGNEKWLARRSLYLLFLPTLFMAVLAITRPGSFASIEIHSGIPVIVGAEWIRWIFYSYSLILVLTSLGVLLACLLRAPAFRAPILLIILGQIFPVLAYAAVDPQWITVSPIQVTILFGGFSVLAYFVALYSFRLLQAIPVARDMVISHMPYSLIVLDAENRLVDFNPAARELPELPGKLALQQPASRALGGWWEQIAPLIGGEPVSQDVVVHAGSEAQIYRVMSLPLYQTSGWRMGQVFVLEDVTQARRAQRQQSQTLWAQATLQERELLADELHDGLSQSLAFLNLQAQAAQVYLRSGQGTAAQASLSRLSEVAGLIQAETRDLIGDLLSVSLPAENFCDTLRLMLTSFEHETGLAVHLEIDRKPVVDTIVDAELKSICDPTRISPTVAVQIVRITQEALANVRKHARGANQVNVGLKDVEGQLLLTIIDDGIGFDPTTPQAGGKHFGLQVMRQRAARIGGHIVIEAAPGKGTCIEVCVPLVANEIRSSG